MPLHRAGPPIWRIRRFWVLGPIKAASSISTVLLKAVILALHHWVTVLQGHQVMIAVDSTTVVSYINKQGGTHYHTLLRLVVDLLVWLQTQYIAIRDRHFPGCLNAIADRLSQPNQPITTEWSLHPEIVNRIFGTWGTPTVDIFATVHNSHFPHVSDSAALSTGDRCSVTRLAGEVDVHVHVSTVSLLNKVIQKLRLSQPFFSASTSSVCGPPLHLSERPGPIVTTGVCLGWQVVPSPHMETLMQHC